MERKEMTCIICPRGCHLVAEINGENITVTGNTCPRGEAYAKQEILDPRRTVTTTVSALSASGLRVCPVKTAAPVPKDMVFAVVEEANKAKLVPPIHIGDVVIHDVAGTGIDLVATREVEE